MAVIVLKDMSATGIEYNGVDQLNVPYKDDNGNMGKIKYTKMTALNSYAVTQQSGGKYLVQKKFEYLPNNNFYSFAVYETECREFDNDGSSSDKGCAVTVIVTPKELNIGETYNYADM